MIDNVVTLRLTATADGVVTGVRLASGEVGKLGPVGKQAGAQASAGITTIGAAAERTYKKVGLLSGTLGQLKGVLAGYAGLMGIKELGRSADVYSDIIGKLKQVTDGERELAQAKAATFRISQDTYQSLDATTTLYTRSAAALAQYGVGQGKIAELTETVNRGLLISRATAQESASAILQLSQAMGAGALRGEEFNAVNEAAPRLMQLLADSLGRPRGELKKLAEDGKLTIDVLLNAFTGANAAKLAAEAAEVPLTIGRAWQKAKNELLLYYGESDQALAASALLATGIASLADNMDVLALGVTVVAAAFAGRLVAATVTYLRTQATLIIQGRVQAQSELLAARAAETHAAARVALGRAGMLASGQLATAEATLAAAQARTAAATQAASLALTAKAGAMRVLNGVMAAFGGPVGIAVTALALFVSWLVSSREEARRTAQEIKTGFEAATQALEAFNKTPTSRGIPTLNDALETGGKLSKQLDELRDKVNDLAERRTRALAKSFDTKDLDSKLAETGRELEYVKARYDALTGATQEATGRIADMIQKSAGLTSVSAETRRAIEDEAREIIRQRLTLEQAQPVLVKHIETIAGAGAAARLAAADYRELDSVIKQFDWSDIDKSLNQQLQAANLRNIELSQGKGARMRAELAQTLTENGAYASGDRAQVEARKAMVETIIKQEAANDALAASQRKVSAAARDGAKASDQAKESQARYTAQAALAAAELRGPLALAQAQSRQKIAELDAELAKHNITRAAHKALVEAETAALAKQSAEIAKQAAAPQALLDAMSGELELLRKIGPERELERRRLEAQQDMRRALADAVEAAGSKEALAARNGAASWKDYEAAMLSAADASAVLSMRVEESARQAEDWVAVWLDGVGRVADAFTNFALSGLRDFKGLAKDLKSIAKQLVGDLIRTFLQQKIVIPIQAQLTQVFGGGTAQAGGFIDVLRSGFDGLLSGIGKLFGRGGAAQQAVQAGTGTAMDGWFGQLKQAGGLFGIAGVPQLPGGQLLGGAGGSAFAGILGPLLGVGLGASMGGDTLGKIGGGLTGGALAMSMLGAGGGLAGLSAGMAAGGIFGGVSGMLGAMGPIGWAALGAMAINSLSGGKLFGTSYKTESASQQWGISDAGASGSQSVTSVKQQSFFRGRKWKTTTSALDAEAMAAVNDLFATLQQTVRQAAQQLGIDVPNIVGGTFKREFDKKGNLTREFGTIAGRVYNEAQDAFAARLVGENLLAVAKAAGSAAELESLANAYRATGEQLQSFATLALAVQEDLRNANGIWAQVNGDGVMTRIVDYIKDMAQAGESLADAYARIRQAITQYSDLIGGVRQQLATYGLSQYQKSQLEIELAYRAQVKQANDLAKALGLSGARAEDLAAIEQLRALNMAELAKQYATQNQQWLQDLSLSDLSPLTDSQKLAESMQLLQDAVAGGDLQRAQKLAEQALGLNRSVNASGSDYNAIYDQVTGLVGDLSTASMEDLLGFTNDELASMADLIDGLPARIAQEMATVLITPVSPQPLPPAPTSAAPTGWSWSTSSAAPSGNEAAPSGTDSSAALTAIAANTAAAAVAAEETLRITKGMALKATA